MRLIVAGLVIGALLVLAGIAAAENTTITTTTTTTVTTTTTITTTTVTNTTEIEIHIINVTFPSKSEGYINVFFVNQSYIELVYVCYSLLVKCPVLHYTLSWDGITYYNDTITPPSSCGGTGVCKLAALIEVNSSVVTMRYRFVQGNMSSPEQVLVLRYMNTSTYPAPVQYILLLIPFAIFSALGLRGSMAMAGIGMVVSVLVIYIASMYGLIPSVNYALPIIAALGVAIFWMSRGSS